MAKMTDEAWQNLSENFETTDILTALDHLDTVRRILADGPNWEPPEIRNDLFKLHDLAMDVVNHGDTSQAQALFELADEIESQVAEMATSVDYLQDVLYKLTGLLSKNLIDDDEWDVEG